MAVDDLTSYHTASSEPASLDNRMIDGKRYTLEGSLSQLSQAAGYQDAKREERQRCIRIIQEEIHRVEALLEVRDWKGKTVFDRAQTEAGLDALRHVMTLIRREE